MPAYGLGPYEEGWPGLALGSQRHSLATGHSALQFVSSSRGPGTPGSLSIQRGG